jgi:alpha-L-arabinofuranosidase
MKLIQLSILLLFANVFMPGNVFANEPDSAYVFAYTTGKQNNTAGLHFAWSIDRKNWHRIGPEFRFLASDFGPWGSQKKLINPVLFQDNNGLYHCLWTLNDEAGQFAHAASANLVNWELQSYPEMMENGNITDLEITFNHQNNHYLITWKTKTNGSEALFKTTTTNFKYYTKAVKILQNERTESRENIKTGSEIQTGTILKTSWDIIDGLIKYHEWSQFHNMERADNTSKDKERFKNLAQVKAGIKLLPEKSKKISDKLIGIFFEDINYAADGGLYAELVQNRGFEYSLADRSGSDPSWNSYMAWTLKGKNATFTIDSLSPVHKNNQHFAVLDIDKPGAALVNEGFDGIPVKAGGKYDFSVFAKIIKGGQKGKLLVRLTDEKDNVIAETETKTVEGGWKKYTATLQAGYTVNKTKLEIIPETSGKIALDMISLFPQNTFKGRKNGLRADLAQAIADIHPKFVRFPGGCVAHGDGLQNMYRWNRTVGPLEARVPQRNIWGYHQSAGLGYFEYFQFCEDIGAIPVPVLPAGVPCQNSGTSGYGQQGGIPMNEMDEYVQEVLDLIEWANGDKNTKWGKVRAEAGHPEPFNLKYIGIGNEDLITDIFEERFTMIFNTVKEKHPEITVIGTVGPFYTGTDYEEGWEIASKLQISMVDEHYYQPPGWFIHNQDFYDRYDRSKSKVYLGEYAAHLSGRPNNIETALSEALYMTSLERNGDIVEMSSYAPLLAKEGHTQWNPDLIYFTNTDVKPTVGYYVQKLFGQNAGETYIPVEIQHSEKNEEVQKRVGMSVVQDKKTNDIILKLVNLLPVEVDADLDLSGINSSGTKAILTVLKGNPTDKDAKPFEREIEVSEKFGYQLPGYSLSVIRIKTKDLL